MAYSCQSLKSKCHHSCSYTVKPSDSMAQRSKSRCQRCSEVPPGEYWNEREDNSSYVPGIWTRLPIFSSYSVRSTAQPRLCRDPCAGSPAKILPSGGVASQNV